MIRRKAQLVRSGGSNHLKREQAYRVVPTVPNSDRYDRQYHYALVDNEDLILSQSSFAHQLELQAERLNEAYEKGFHKGLQFNQEITNGGKR